MKRHEILAGLLALLAGLVLAKALFLMGTLLSLLL